MFFRGNFRSINKLKIKFIINEVTFQNSRKFLRIVSITNCENLLFIHI